MPGILWSTPKLEIKNYDNIFDFSRIKAVLIKKGDNLKYSELSYDDSGWKHISLPSNWSSYFPGYKGICWYRIPLKLPEGLPANSIGIRLGVISDVDEVYFNGIKFGGSGRFPPGRISAYDKKRLYEIPTKLIKPGRNNLLSIRVAGMFPEEGGAYKGKFLIGYFSRLQIQFFSEELFDSFFVVIYLVVALYFCLVFVRRSIEKEYLFFSLFTLCSAVYLFLRTELKYLFFKNFLLLKRIEYFCLFLVLVLMMEYITQFFKTKHSIFHYIYYGISFLSIIFVLIFNDPYLWNRILLYAIEPAWLIPIIFCVYISFREYKNGEGAKYLLFAFVIIWLIFINDVLVDRKIYRFFRLSNYGFLTIIISSAVIMRNRFKSIYSEAELFRKKRFAKPSITRETKEKLDKVIDYLNENYNSDISREGLAESVGINMDYLGKLFKEYTGKKINDYINDMRIREASRLLIKDDAKVIDIAYSVGFDNLSTFYRIFQSIMGESPTSFREKHTGKNSL